jgi:hypothetical protein
METTLTFPSNRLVKSRIYTAKSLKFERQGLAGKFLNTKTLSTIHGLIRTWTFDTNEGEVTIWNSMKLFSDLTKLKPNDKVVIVYKGTSTTPSGHSLDDYEVYKLM